MALGKLKQKYSFRIYYTINAFLPGLGKPFCSV